MSRFKLSHKQVGVDREFGLFEFDGYGPLAKKLFRTTAVPSYSGSAWLGNVGKTVSAVKEGVDPKLKKLLLKKQSMMPSAYAMSAEQLGHLHELGLATQVTPGGMLGNTLVAGYQGDDIIGAQTGHGKTAYKQKKKRKKGVQEDINVQWPTNRQQFVMEQRRFGVTLLGLPSDFEPEFDAAEKILEKKLGRKVPNLFKPDAQARAPLPAPIPKYKQQYVSDMSPNEEDLEPGIEAAIARILKKNSPSNLAG